MEAAAAASRGSKRVKREPTAKELAKAAKLEALLVRTRAQRTHGAVCPCARQHAMCGRRRRMWAAAQPYGDTLTRRPAAARAAQFGGSEAALAAFDDAEDAQADDAGLSVAALVRKARSARQLQPRRLPPRAAPTAARTLTAARPVRARRARARRPSRVTRRAARAPRRQPPPALPPRPRSGALCGRTRRTRR
jgi:hypothetical protein